MADREAQQNIYSYNEMSSKVMQADRSARRAARNEPTGEVESLRAGAMGRMGDRIATSQKKSRAVEVEAKMERANKKRQKREGHGSKKSSMLGASGGQTILDLGSLTGYQPSTPSSQAAYENLLVCTVLLLLCTVCCNRFIVLTYVSLFLSTE